MMCAEEVFEIAKKIKMPVYMYDTDSALFWLSRFAKAAETPSPEERECFGKPARYWYDAFQIAEGLRADAERRVQENRRDAGRFRWLLHQPAPEQDSLLRPPIPPELLEEPGKWPDLVRAAIDARLEPQERSTPE